MATRQAKVTSISVHDDEFSMKPYVETVRLSPTNCTDSEFMDWLLTAAMTRKDLGCGAGDGNAAMAYIDESSPYAVGDIVSISFDDHIVNSINRSGMRAKQHIVRLAKDAISRL